ncbi:MAG: hypothetical protein AAGI11_20805 [Pseudomonadota bacterium]
MTKPQQVNEATLRDAEKEAHKGIRAWIARELGGEVRSITRLERWRPQWKVTFVAADEVRAVLVRGNRPIAPVSALRFEMDVMEVLEKNGIKVPHIYGWMDSPAAFVMDWIDTEDRAPGMLHTAIENPSTMSDERWQAMLNYMRDLAAVHEVPVSEFANIKGMNKHLDTAEGVALHAVEKMFQGGLYTDKIDPPLAYLQHWLRSNVPQHRTEVRFLAGDAGQFMSAGTDVLALLDFEIASIGDFHWDLACFRGRHPYENMGDIPALYREYERVSGRKVELEVVAYHTVAFLQLSGIAAKFFCTPDAKGGNWIEGALEYGSIIRRAYEAIAELKGIELDYDLELPTPLVDEWESSGLQKLMVDIEHLPTSSVFEPWERELMHSIPNFLHNYSQYRSWFELGCIKDAEALTGGSYADVHTANQALMEMIGKGGELDEALFVQAMHRRQLRFSMIVAGTAPNDDNPLFHRLDPIL